ncbi:MAG: tRNA pseudouridine(38-40) synthase TruA, partial [Actinobacteria bacterium]|nr:tRNA pseudouridine(38-40) synthase TruA [Actinomycetota bacterium]
MPAWRLDLEYDGTGFHGWARQPGLRTVQAEVEAALSTVVRETIRLRVAGRTDAGVHAWGQVASFDTSPAVAAAIEPRRLLLSLNALLPEDVAVTAVTPAPAGFNARAARSRTYRYRVWHGVPCPVRER